MLVLSRKVGQRVLIGEAIVVTVVRIGPSSLRLGIQAPRHMNIVREELGPIAENYREIEVPLDDVSVLGLFSDCADCRTPVLDCNCVGADA